jgi:hypothetical protein
VCGSDVARSGRTSTRAPCFSRLVRSPFRGRRGHGSAWRQSARVGTTLIEWRHSYENLVIMCSAHSTVIDDPAQGYTIEQVVEIKRAHEKRRTASAARRSPRATRSSRWLPPRPPLLARAPAWHSGCTLPTPHQAGRSRRSASSRTRGLRAVDLEAPGKRRAPNPRPDARLAHAPFAGRPGGKGAAPNRPTRLCPEPDGRNARDSRRGHAPFHHSRPWRRAPGHPRASSVGRGGLPLFGC